MSTYSPLILRKEDIPSSGLTNAQLGFPKIMTHQQTITRSQFTDGGSASGTKTLSVSIPEGAVFLQSAISRITGFAGDTSAVVTIGDGTDVDRYNTGTPSVFATADHVSTGSPSGTAYHSGAKTPTITVTSGADFTSVSAGQMTVTLFWYQVA